MGGAEGEVVWGGLKGKSGGGGLNGDSGGAEGTPGELKRTSGESVGLSWSWGGGGEEAEPEEGARRGQSGSSWILNGDLCLDQDSLEPDMKNG